MTPSTCSPAALNAAWSKLPLAERQRLIAIALLPPVRATPEKLLNRTDAARRIGYSRSWLHLFLRNHREDIPAHLRPDRQCVSNRISVAFVEWFLLEGHRLVRRPPETNKVTPGQGPRLRQAGSRRGRRRTAR